MESPWDSILIAVGSALAGLITAFVAAFLKRDREKAEQGNIVATGADEVVGSALSIVKEMRIDVASLRARIEELERENAELRCTVEAQGRTIARLEEELEKYRPISTGNQQERD